MVRKPNGYEAKELGDIIWVDTLNVRPLPGIVFKQFIAGDIVSSRDEVKAHTRVTSNTVAGFIDTLLTRMPLPIKAIQVDGESEFQDAFERGCRRRWINLFFLPPQALGYLTPQEFLKLYQQNRRKEEMSLII